MRVFKTNVFDKLASKDRLTDPLLIEAAKEIAAGLTGDALGGNLFKKRLARRGQGKSGSYRTILVYRSAQKEIYFLYCFAKNQKANLSIEELKAFRLLEKRYSKFTDADIGKLLAERELLELENEDE